MTSYQVHDDGPLADVPTSREVEGRETVFDGMVWDVTRDAFRMAPDTPVLRREYIRHPGAVAVVALDQAQRVCVIRQYRHPVGQELWEIPAGLLDVDGEPMLEAAQRELAEEADLVAAQWEVLVDFFTTPGSSSEGIRIYLARDLTPVPEQERHAREGEEAGMPLAWVPLDEVVSAVLDGRVHNPSLCMGVLAAQVQAATGFSSLRPADAPWTDHPRERA